MTSKERQKRSERRFRCIARPKARHQKENLMSTARDLREEERMARKAGVEPHAEEYRRAANAVENAIAELEDYLSEDELTRTANGREVAKGDSNE